MNVVKSKLVKIAKLRCLSISDFHISSAGNSETKKKSRIRVFLIFLFCRQFETMFCLFCGVCSLGNIHSVSGTGISQFG